MVAPQRLWIVRSRIHNRRLLLAIALLTPVAINIGMAVIAVARYPAFFSQPGARRFLFEPIGALLIYLVAIVLVSRTHGPNWDAILKTAILFGGLTGILEVANICIENGIPFSISGPRVAPGFMLVVFTLWGVAGYRTTRSLGSVGAGVLTSVSSACICMLTAVAAGFAVEFFLAPPASAHIASWAEYQRSGWTDPRAFAIANTFESGFTHLVVAPIVASVFGGVGALVGRWYSQKMRAFLAIVAALVLPHVANAQETISFPTEDGGVVFGASPNGPADKLMSPRLYIVARPTQFPRIV